MNEFLSRTMASIEAVCLGEAKVEDLGPVVEGEKVIGEVESDFTKKAFLLMKQLIRDVKDETAKILGNYPSPGELIGSLISENNGDHVAILSKLASIEASFAEMKPEADAKMRDAEYLHGLFWNSVRQELPEARLVEKLGVREGWQIVTLAEEEEDCNCPACTLKKVLGGGGPRGVDVHVVCI